MFCVSLYSWWSLWSFGGIRKQCYTLYFNIMLSLQKMIIKCVLVIFLKESLEDIKFFLWGFRALVWSSGDIQQEKRCYWELSNRSSTTPYPPLLEFFSVYLANDSCFHIHTDQWPILDYRSVNKWKQEEYWVIGQTSNNKLHCFRLK